MVPPSPLLAHLSGAERAELETRLIDFDLRWDSDRLSSGVRELPAKGALRRTALIEMIKIDLGRRWQCGQLVGIEFYLGSYPEIEEFGCPPLDLVETEAAVRAQFGTPPDEAEWWSRFPGCGERLGELFRTRVSHQTQLHAPALAGASIFGGAGGACELSGTFGRYQIRRTLGSGGMGSVYLADDTELGRAVALKVPHAFRPDDTVSRERFRREGRAAAALDHPNLCRVYDVGEYDGVPYLTMAFVEGQPLGDPTAGALGQYEVAALVQKVARALAYAHARGVIHRDLKPSNVLIDARGEPVVADFGLARREGAGDPQLTRDGEPLGTPAYMSPEQVAGRAENIGPATDIFSLGVIMYQLLTGRLPFRGNVGEVMVQIAIDDPPRPAEVRPGIDPHLEAACLTALAKAPADRFASMEEFATSLDLQPRPPKAAPRKPIGARALAAVAVAGAITVCALVIRCDRDDRDSGTQLKGGPHDEQKRLAGATSGQELGPEVAPLPRLFVPPPLILRGHEAGVTAVGFGGDGQVVSADDWSVRTWDRRSGKQVFDAGKPAGPGGWKRLGVALSPDGRRFVDHFIGPVKLQDARTGEMLLTEDETGMHNGPKAFSANGKRVALGTRSALGDTATVVWDVDANKTYTFKKYGDARGVLAVALTADGKRAASASAEPGDGVRVWETESGEELRHWPKLAATALAFTLDGRLTLTGSVLGEVALRDPATGKDVARFEGHGERITSVAFSADGRRLVTASADGTARVWDAGTHQELECLKGHTGAVTCAALSADGSVAATGGADRTVRVWTLKP